MADWNIIAAELAAVLRERKLVVFGVALPVTNPGNEPTRVVLVPGSVPLFDTPERRAVWAGWLLCKVRESWCDPGASLVWRHPYETTNKQGMWVIESGANWFGATTDIGALVLALKAAPEVTHDR